MEGDSNPNAVALLLIFCLVLALMLHEPDQQQANQVDGRCCRSTDIRINIPSYLEAQTTSESEVTLTQDIILDTSVATIQTGYSKSVPPNTNFPSPISFRIERSTNSSSSLSLSQGHLFLALAPTQLSWWGHWATSPQLAWATSKVATKNNWCWYVAGALIAGKCEPFDLTAQTTTEGEVNVTTIRFTHFQVP